MGPGFYQRGAPMLPYAHRRSPWGLASHVNVCNVGVTFVQLSDLLGLNVGKKRCFIFLDKIGKMRPKRDFRKHDAQNEPVAQSFLVEDCSAAPCGRLARLRETQRSLTTPFRFLPREHPYGPPRLLRRATVYHYQLFSILSLQNPSKIFPCK